MPYNFKQLKNQLASMVGAEDVSDLVDSDAQHIADVINQVYHECYTPIDGRRARWTERYFAWTVPASRQVTATVSKGSTTMTLSTSADDLGTQYLGSHIRFGTADQPYIVASRVSSTSFRLLEPYAEESGIKTATFYCNAYDLGVSAADLCEAPELVGYGLLSPMSGVANELTYRSFLRGDYAARPGQGYGNSLSLSYDGTAIEEGVPLFYYVDYTQLNATAVPTARFVVYPMPTQAYRMKVRANIIPTLLTSDADVPLLPLEAVTTVLLPAARARFAMVSRRYNGDNRQMLERDLKDAFQRLKSFSQPQKQTSRRVKLRTGF
jgi:hypothetical protein